MKYIAIAVIDSWHIANGQHFGDIVWDYNSTPVLFPTRMKAVQASFDMLKKKYGSIEPVSKKGLKDAYDNELSYYGREFHIIAFEVRDKE